MDHSRPVDLPVRPNAGIRLSPPETGQRRRCVPRWKLGAGPASRRVGQSDLLLGHCNPDERP
jgi:hypothetical protein